MIAGTVVLNLSEADVREALRRYVEAEIRGAVDVVSVDAVVPRPHGNPPQRMRLGFVESTTECSAPDANTVEVLVTTRRPEAKTDAQPPALNESRT